MAGVFRKGILGDAGDCVRGGSASRDVLVYEVCGIKRYRKILVCYCKTRKGVLILNRT